MKDTTNTTNAPAVIELGADLSHAVKALEAAYRMIQKRHPEVPNATIVVKRDARAWGHTTIAKVWSPAKAETADRLEIMISGENLARGSVFVAATLIHEAAHARNLANGVLDTDVNGRHNKSFKESAELLGLTVESQGWHGFTATSLTDDQAGAWKRMIATLDRGLVKSAKAAAPAPVILPPAVTPGGVTVVTPGTVVPPRKRGGTRTLLKAVCGCDRSIRVSRSVLDDCRPTCQICEQEFEVV